MVRTGSNSPVNFLACSMNISGDSSRFSSELSEGPKLQSAGRVPTGDLSW